MADLTGRDIVVRRPIDEVAMSWHGSKPTILFAVLLIVVIVAVDLMFFKNRFWPRLMFNIGAVLVFGAFYQRSIGQ